MSPASLPIHSSRRAPTRPIWLSSSLRRRLRTSLRSRSANAACRRRSETDSSSPASVSGCKGTAVATDRPSSQQFSLIDPQKLGEAAGFGVCNGDSGGPVFDERDRALVGIVSWSAHTDGEPTCGFVSGVIPLARYRYWSGETAARLGSSLEP